MLFPAFSGHLFLHTRQQIRKHAIKKLTLPSIAVIVCVVGCLIYYRVGNLFNAPPLLRSAQLWRPLWSSVPSVAHAPFFYAFVFFLALPGRFSFIIFHSLLCAVAKIPFHVR